MKLRKTMRRFAAVSVLIAVLSVVIMSESTKAAEEEPIHWAKEELKFVIMNDGIHDLTHFDPDEPITRAQLIYMLLRIKGIEPVYANLKTRHFYDVPREEWYYPYVETTYKMGITNGQKEGGKNYFLPNEPVTRQELATFVIRAMGEEYRVDQIDWRTVSGLLSPFGDAAEVDDWARDDMAYLVEQGWINHFPDPQSLQPKKQATYAEAAVLAFHGIGKTVSELKSKEVNGVSIVYQTEMTVETTAYNKDEPGLSTHTYTGMYVRKGVVAVDPDLIPLGTHLYIEGYGYAVAADIGSAVNHHHIDLYVPTLQEALEHGRQHGVKVYILD